MSAPQNTTRLWVQVRPNAAINEITGYTDGRLHIKIAAPPLKGKANKELVAFLSCKLGINQSSVSIMKGQTARNKLVSIYGLSLNDIIKLLLPAQGDRLI